MRFLHSLLLAGAPLLVCAASTKGWNFDEAIVSVTSKGSGVGGGFKDKLSDHVPLTAPVELGVNDALKIVLTATEDGKAKRPHQAFLLVRDQETGLEATFAFGVKESGKAKVDLTTKDLPLPLLHSTTPLRATLLLASFGTSPSFSNHVFNLKINADDSAPFPAYEKALRYGQREEIRHIFKADPKSGPAVISVVFVLAILATVPVLAGAWLALGANLSHLSTAISNAPISHALFFGSIVAIEGIFFLYYYSWNLFQTLPVAGVVGLVAFLSGSKALGEVQGRRLKGER